MRRATAYATQWAGLVAQVQLLGRHAPGAELIRREGMVASIIPSVPGSSLMNVALTPDPEAVATRLGDLAERFAAGGAAKWGLWVDARNARAAEVAMAQGMVLDSTPLAMVAVLDALSPQAAAALPPRRPVALDLVGRINDEAYGYAEPKLGPALSALPPEPAVITYAAARDNQQDAEAVALAHDHGDDTAVWYVATRPHAQRNGLAGQILRRLLLDATDRGQRTASLQASAKGAPLYTSLGFETVGTLHLYEQPLGR
jgi:GNAT superfamily N-acetyltransferase